MITHIKPQFLEIIQKLNLIKLNKLQEKMKEVPLRNSLASLKIKILIINLLSKEKTIKKMNK